MICHTQKDSHEFIFTVLIFAVTVFSVFVYDKIMRNSFISFYIGFVSADLIAVLESIAYKPSLNITLDVIIRISVNISVLVPSRHIQTALQNGIHYHSMIHKSGNIIGPASCIEKLISVFPQYFKCASSFLIIFRKQFETTEAFGLARSEIMHYKKFLQMLLYRITKRRNKANNLHDYGRFFRIKNRFFILFFYIARILIYIDQRPILVFFRYHICKIHRIDFILRLISYRFGSVGLSVQFQFLRLNIQIAGFAYLYIIFIVIFNKKS